LARIELLTVIAAPCERCFDLARSVDLHLRSTSHTSESAIGGRISGLMTLGDEVTWRARHFGVWFTLTSRITAYDRPEHFRDRMVRGPLARLDHSHEFADDGQGGTPGQCRRVTVLPRWRTATTAVSHEPAPLRLLCGIRGIRPETCCSRELLDGAGNLRSGTWAQREQLRELLRTRPSACGFPSAA